MAYDMLAIVMGIETFSDHCKDSVVKIWTDNKGGEHAMRKQSSKAVDHNKLAHLTWLKGAAINAGLWFERVPTKGNIADGPTRPDGAIGLSVLKLFGAVKVQARFPRELLECDYIRNL